MKNEKAVGRSGRVHIILPGKGEIERKTLCGLPMNVYGDDVMPEDAPVTCRRCLRALEKEKGHGR